MPANPVNAYAWSEVASLEGNPVARRERDASLRDLNESNQAVSLVGEILNRVKRKMPASAAQADDDRGNQQAQ
jgi:hypothetical protein